MCRLKKVAFKESTLLLFTSKNCRRRRRRERERERQGTERRRRRRETDGARGKEGERERERERDLYTNILIMSMRSIVDFTGFLSV